MRRKNLVLILSILLCAVFVYATTTIVTEDIGIAQSATVGTWHPNHSLSNITDDNFTTYAVTQVNNTYAMINVTKREASDSESRVQITFNSSSDQNKTNFTMSDFQECWDYVTTKLVYRLGSNFTQNLSNFVTDESITPLQGVTISFNNTRTVSVVVYNRSDTYFTSNESFIALNGTSVSLNNDDIIIDSGVVYNQSVTKFVVNETNTTSNNLVLINGSNMTVTNTRSVSNVNLFNCSARISVTNETNITNSNLVWGNTTNATLLNTDSVELVRPYNCSVRISVFNETNTTLNNLVWINDSNMTLENTFAVDVSSVKVMNCTDVSLPPYGSGNYTAFSDGNIFVSSISTIPNGTVVCLNYTYQGLGFGTEIGSGNFTAFSDGNIFMISNSTIADGEGFCANYTYQGPGFGIEIGSGNYTAFSDGNIFVTSNSTVHDNTVVCANYTYVADDIINEGDNYTINYSAGTIKFNEGATQYNSSTLGINYSYRVNGSVIGSGNYTVVYLDGTINFSTNYANNSLTAVNYTFLDDSTPKNKRECYNGSIWVSMGTESDEDELYDFRMYWSAPGSDWDIDYFRPSPVGITDSNYFPSESTTVVFNITVNISSSPENQSTVNVSLLIGFDRKFGNYTRNISSTVLINTSYVNVTLTFNNGERIFWFWEIMDNQSRTIENTTRRTIDIDSILEIISVGDETRPINFSADTGDAVFKGDVTANSFTGNGLTLNNVTVTSTCDSTKNGNLVYNATPHKLLFCNSTVWKVLN